MNAQEMFEELGYDKIVEDAQFIYYKHKLNKTNLMIIIDILWKEYACVENKVSREITLEEHQAIHQKIKELGWIE